MTEGTSLSPSTKRDPNVNCSACGTPIFRRPSRIKRNKNCYCSRDCKNNSKVAAKYGHWEVIGELEKAPGKRYRVVPVRCKCGLEKKIRLNSLESGASTQCLYCAKKGRTPANRTHGEAGKTVEWGTWMAIKRRCRDSSSDYYGKRGITVCDRWQGPDGFQHFLGDMGRRPSSSHSIDRIDVNGNYEPGNCRWATSKEQCNNRTKHILLTIYGETKTLAEWVEGSEIDYNTAWSRHRAGWDPHKIIETPVHYRGQAGREE